jgi:hypothetical protein
MTSAINSSAGTASIQSLAMKQRTSAPTGTAPSAPAAAPRSAAEANVSRLFQLTHQISGQLQSLLDGAEANRISGGEGVDSGQTQQSVAQITAQVQEFVARGRQMGRFTEELSAQLSKIVVEGRGSNQRLAETVQATQAALAEKYGYVGHLVNKTA